MDLSTSRDFGVLTASDASFAGEPKDRSQRVCRATPQAETYALQNAQESGDRMRAALAELYGNGSKGTDWDLRARMKNPAHFAPPTAAV